MNAPIEWTLEEKVACVKEAGFEYLECWLPTQELRENVPPLIEKYALKMVIVHRAMNVAETRETIDYAARVGAEWVICQPASAYHTLSEVVHLIREGTRMAAGHGFLYLVETHRGSFTESIRQTLELIEVVPDIQLVADVSHFVLGGEFSGAQAEEFISRIRPIIDRVAHVHGRISNGEQVQVDVGDGERGAAIEFFKEIWGEIFKTWRHKAQRGDILPFSSELGPPPYAMTLPDGREFSDRWEQSLVMKKLAEQIWTEANEEHLCGAMPRHPIIAEVCAL